jgi:hypothetical protein
MPEYGFQTLIRRNGTMIGSGRDSVASMADSVDKAQAGEAFKANKASEPDKASNEEQARKGRAKAEPTLGQRLFEKIKHPHLRWVRAPIGALLIIGGILGFMPILGFWMIPLGLSILALDFLWAERVLSRLHRRMRWLRRYFHPFWKKAARATVAPKTPEAGKDGGAET